MKAPVRRLPTKLITGPQSELISRYGVLFAILLVVLAVTESITPAVLAPSNLAGMSVFGVEVGLLALGETVVILGGGGGIDLSVGAMLAVSQVVLGVLFQAHVNVWIAALAALLAGVAMGTINGLFITVLGIPAILVTLATLYAYQGIALVLAKGVDISGFPPSFGILGQSRVLGIPFQLLVIYLPTAALLWYAISRSLYGYRVRLSGTNATAAFLSGINVGRTRFKGYVIAGLLSSMAAVIQTSRVVTARPDAGATANLAAITIAVLGGTSIFGGEGTVGGTVLATLVIALLSYSFALANINSVLETGIVGLILIVAIAGQLALKAFGRSAARAESSRPA